MKQNFIYLPRVFYLDINLGVELTNKSFIVEGY